MRKNRNSFFSESSMSYQGYNPNMIPQQMPPMQVPNNYNSLYNNQNPMGNIGINQNDLESRLAKIERQINRLEHRINKLETNSNCNNDIYDNTTNMYML